MNYLCFKVEEAEFEENTLERKAFRKHLNLIARTLKAIEWNDSGDGDDQEADLIKQCLSDKNISDATLEMVDVFHYELSVFLSAYGNK